LSVRLPCEAWRSSVPTPAALRMKIQTLTFLFSSRTPEHL
jgi:hypothetical protein